MKTQIDQTRNRNKNRRSAMVLVVVLVVIAVLTLASYTFSELMLTEHQATRVVARQGRRGRWPNRGRSCCGFLCRKPRCHHPRRRHVR